MAVRYKVIITPEAQEQVHQIVSYWDEIEDFEKGTAVLDQISNAFDTLEEMPSRHAPVPSISTRGTMYRRILSRPYRIIFTMNEQLITVTVVDVDYEKRDPQILIDKFIA